MADEKKTNEGMVEKKENKFVTFFKNLPHKIATPFKNMWHELKKVTWPTRQALLKYIAIVACFMVFMGVVIGLLDLGASKLVTALSSLNPNNTAAEEHDHDHDHAEDEAQVEEPAEGETVQDDTAAETTEAPAGN